MIRQTYTSSLLFSLQLKHRIIILCMMQRAKTRSMLSYDSLSLLATDDTSFFPSPILPLLLSLLHWSLSVVKRIKQEVDRYQNSNFFQIVYAIFFFSSERCTRTGHKYCNKISDYHRRLCAGTYMTKTS